MKLQNIYIQNNIKEIERLISQSKTCLLATHLNSGNPQFGVFNPLLMNHCIYLHHSRSDEQVGSLREDSKCRLIFQDILGIVPSNWVDERYAGAATTYYRYAELIGTSTLIEDPADQINYYRQIMQHFQPGHHFDPIDYNSSIYKGKIDSILLTKFTIQSVRAKWKLGQNRSIELRKKVARLFRERNLENDRRAAEEIERWIELNQN
jgi:predicted FMN-binding regulatory protein PaiB